MGVLLGRHPTAVRTRPFCLLRREFVLHLASKTQNSSLIDFITSWHWGPCQGFSSKNNPEFAKRSTKFWFERDVQGKFCPFICLGSLKSFPALSRCWEKMNKQTNSTNMHFIILVFQIFPNWDDEMISSWGGLSSWKKTVECYIAVGVMMF